MTQNNQINALKLAFLKPLETTTTRNNTNCKERLSQAILIVDNQNVSTAARSSQKQQVILTATECRVETTQSIENMAQIEGNALRNIHRGAQLRAIAQRLALQHMRIWKFINQDQEAGAIAA